jgi:P27 family predicted phage terminase small subunit
MTKKRDETHQAGPAEPPAHLSERAKKIWREVVYRVRSPGRVVMLQTALEALDRADEAREAVSKEGLTVTTKTTGAVHVHPLLKVEKDQRALFSKLWRELALHWDSKIDG